MQTFDHRIVRSPRGTSGSALLFALVIAMGLAGLCWALLAVTVGTKKSRVQSQGDQRAFYAAEAGLSDAYMRLTEQTLVVGKVPAYIGSADAPMELGTSAYYVEILPDGSRGYSLVSTGLDGSNVDRLELLVTKEPTGFFQFAAFGAEGVVLDSNAFIDSYDSADGSYESQVSGGNEFAKENGDVGSNKDILLKANTEVHGDAQPGPGHVVIDSAPNIYVSGSKDPLKKEFELPPIVIPSIASSGALTGTGTVTLGPGLVHYNSILMKGGSHLIIKGPATVVAGDFQMKSNSKLTFDAAGGEIELYSEGDFLLESNTKVKTLSNSALDVALMLAGDNIGGGTDKLQLGSNSEFIGAIYAPNAKFSLGSNFNVFGSIMCGSLDLSSFGTIHFDEALLYDGPGSTGELETVLWRRLPKP